MDGEALRFASALDIGGVTQERVTMTGRARLTLPDRDVTLVLRWAPPSGRAPPFERLDWRPLSDHTNKADAPGALRLLRIEGSQRHPLAPASASEARKVAATYGAVGRWAAPRAAHQAAKRAKSCR